MPLIETKGAASAQGFGLTLGSSGPVTYIEDVFSTYLYTGNGSTQTITNGIDLAGKGGLVWLKSRSSPNWRHCLFDTQRGVLNRISSNNTDAQQTVSYSLTSFNSNGFSLDGAYNENEPGTTYASWTFREQPKFFDVVTYTGNGANRTISHNLGSVPGCIIVKCTSTTGNWVVYHRSAPSSLNGYLNTTDDFGFGPMITSPTSTQFSINTAAAVNTNGETYVAYLFAHDAGGFGLTGSDNVISCGSYTGNGSATGPTVTLGYEPQWLMIKKASGTGNWNIFDNMRGLTVSGQNDAYLEANTADAEASADWVAPNATEFQITTTSSELNTNTSTYIYVAIRRGPMKTPTSGASVFSPTVYTGTNVDNRLVDTGLLTDMAWVRQRNDTVLGGMVVGDRLRGDPYFLTGTTDAEVSDADSFMTPTSGYGNSWSAMNGFGVGNDATSKLNASTTSNNQIAEGFRRAPRFFDISTGPDATQTAIPHNLTVAPEMLILKRVSSVPFFVAAYIGTTFYNNLVWADYLSFISNGAATTSTPGSNSLGNSTTFNATSVGAGGVWFAGNTIAYLFATCPGVSKVGSYTGTGTTLQVDCGFTGGARFVLIKRTDSTGDWYVWDSARGIVAGNDPYLLLNSTAAEVTNTDYVDTYSAGFEISSTAPAAINANGGTYIFLAIA